MSESSSPPQAESLQPPIQFFYTEHVGEETATTLAERLQDYDVVAVEFITASDNRAEVQDFANQITHAATPEEAEQLLRYNGRFSGKFWKSLLHGLAGTNKDIVIVDANREDVPEASTMFEEAQAIRDGVATESTATIMSHLKAQTEATVAMNARREHLVAEQVRDIASQLEPGRRLAVFQGTAHTPTYLELKREGLDVERDFITNQTLESDFPGTKQAYGLFSTLVRQLSIKPDSPVPEEDWQRVLLSIYAKYAAQDKPPEESGHYIELVEDALRRADKAEFQNLLQEIDHIREVTHPGVEENAPRFRERIRNLVDSSLGTDFSIAA